MRSRIGCCCTEEFGDCIHIIKSFLDQFLSVAIWTIVMCSITSVRLREIISSTT